MLASDPPHDRRARMDDELDELSVTHRGWLLLLLALLLDMIVVMM